jgi:hypothetical protein
MTTIGGIHNAFLVSKMDSSISPIGLVSSLFEEQDDVGVDSAHNSVKRHCPTLSRTLSFG